MFTVSLVSLLFISLAAPLGMQAPAPPACYATLAPEVTFGDAFGSGGFSDVADLTVDADGNVYVLERLNKTIRRFGPQGEPRGSLGREGRGPGEFISPQSVGWLRDTIWVVDYGTRETLLLSEDGVELGRVAPLSMRPPYLASPAVGLLEGDRAVFQAWVSDELIARGDVESRPLIVGTRAGEKAKTIFDVMATHSVLSVRPPGYRRGGLLAVQPFADDPIWAVHPDGQGIVVVERPASTSGDPGEYIVRWFDPDGIQTIVQRFEYLPRLLRDRFVEDYVTERVDWLLALPMQTFASREQAEEAVRGALFLPKYLPPVTDVLVGRSGEVWLERERTGSRVRRWDTLAPQGGGRKAVCVPAAVDVLFVDDLVAYGVQLDDRDIPIVLKLSGRGTAPR